MSKQSTGGSHPPQTIKGTVIGQHGAYTVILRQRHLEFYETNKGPWEKRNVPDFLLTPDETEGLFDFLLLVYPAQNIKTVVFEK